MTALPLFETESNAPAFDIASEYSSDNAITLHQGDSCAFLKTLPDSLVSLVMTSPPYNIGKAYEHKQDVNAHMAEQEAVIAELVRIVSDDGSIC